MEPRSASLRGLRLEQLEELLRGHGEYLQDEGSLEAGFLWSLAMGLSIAIGLFFAGWFFFLNPFFKWVRSGGTPILGKHHIRENVRFL